MFQWAEDDFDLPAGVVRLGLSEPLSGKQYVMYHGTTRAVAQVIKATGFKQSEDGMLGRGVYLSRDLQKASRYPIDHPEYDKVVIKVTVNVGKVIAINYQGHPRQKTWHDHGYDTAWVPPNCGMVRSGLEEDCVWDPERIQILSVINPQPVQTRRPVQPSTSWGASGNCDFDSHRYSCPLYRPMFDEPMFGRPMFDPLMFHRPMFHPLMFDPPSPEPLSEPDDHPKGASSKAATGKKKGKGRGTTAKKKTK